MKQIILYNSFLEIKHLSKHMFFGNNLFNTDGTWKKGSFWSHYFQKIFQHKNISETKLSTLGFQTLNWIKSFFFHPFFVLTRLSFKIVTIYFENFFFVQKFLQDCERLQSEHFNWESILQFEEKNNLQKCWVSFFIFWSKRLS